MKNIIYFLLAALILFSACNNNGKANIDKPEEGKVVLKTLGKIERLDPLINTIIPEGAMIEVLADGFGWSEGPLWIDDGQYVIFADIPANSIMKWKEGEGLSLYLKPSGYTGTESGEGANGLLLDHNNNLVLCQHGDRRMARMDAAISSPQPKYITIADNYNGKKFNSPNDAVYHSSGALYFTDPPYGLKGQDEDPEKEILYNGVYRADEKGNTILLDDQLTRPNGIALSIDEQTLYVANSDPKNPIIKAYDVKEDGSVENGRVFFDTSPLMGEGINGLPDGMKVDKHGYIFATGPGGVLVLTPDGKHIGTIETGVSTANCALGGDGYIYLTSHMYLTRVKLL